MKEQISLAFSALEATPTAADAPPPTPAAPAVAPPPAYELEQDGDHVLPETISPMNSAAPTVQTTLKALKLWRALCLQLRPVGENAAEVVNTVLEKCGWRTVLALLHVGRVQKGVRSTSSNSEFEILLQSWVEERTDNSAEGALSSSPDVEAYLEGILVTAALLQNWGVSVKRTVLPSPKSLLSDETAQRTRRLLHALCFGVHEGNVLAHFVAGTAVPRLSSDQKKALYALFAEPSCERAAILRVETVPGADGGAAFWLGVSHCASLNVYVVIMMS